ncbi:Ubiquitin carboxyl-terminal hydrolase 25 [Goodea atripinnis]|uniref:Ubiquitin carboxyl-terminal hydrolase 25 n=1 Tax=Goodea atripinnis TaxID=208336 RepID=A0ABV0N0P6_9TELE
MRLPTTRLPRWPATDISVLAARQTQVSKLPPSGMAQNVIDLTGDDKDDLQRAIALSLEESNRAFRETGITDEEQAISRVLEASIAENKASLKRTHTEVWSDSPNPHDRKRIDNCPVGLKNSLFNLLEFQRLVLNYSPPARVLDLPRNQKVC